jgi:protein-tyrosine phosphatase
MSKEFIDHHCHILPAVDDGSTDLQESLAIAGILASFGFSTVHCSPHRIKGCFDNEPAMVLQATRNLQRAVMDVGLSLRLIPSTEHYLDEFLIDQLDGAVTTGSARLMLVEAPFRLNAEMVPVMVASLLERGMVPLIAHPERCSAFDPPRRGGGFSPFSFFKERNRSDDIEGSMISRLRQEGCRFQANIGSFAGQYGSDVKERAILFLKSGIYSCIGSDAHRSERLASTLAAGFDTVASTIGESAALSLFQGEELAE